MKIYKALKINILTLAVVAALSMLAPSAHASYIGACTGNSLATLNGNTCSSDNNLYLLNFGDGGGDFSAVNNDTLSSQIMVTVSGDTVNQISVVFSSTNNNSFGNSTANQSAYYDFFYSITPVNANYGIIQETLTLVNAITQDSNPFCIPGFGCLTSARTSDVTGQKVDNNQGIFVQNTTNNQNELANTNDYESLTGTRSVTWSNVSHIADFITLANHADIWFNNEKMSSSSRAFIGDSAHPGTIINTFLVAPLEGTSTPEPMSMLLVGSGLVGLGLVYRKRRRA